jgi:gluconate kinase
MECFKKLKLWWKRHVNPGLNGRLEELEEQLEVLVYKQELAVSHIMKLKRHLRNEIRKTKRLEVMWRQAMEERDRTRKESEAPHRVKQEIQGSKVKDLKEFFENIKE